MLSHVAQAAHKLARCQRMTLNFLASTSGMLGLRECAVTPGLRGAGNGIQGLEHAKYMGTGYLCFMLPSPAPELWEV